MAIKKEKTLMDIRVKIPVLTTMLFTSLLLFLVYMIRFLLFSIAALHPGQT